MQQASQYKGIIKYRPYGVLGRCSVDVLSKQNHLHGHFLGGL